jgi:hypothetical protein
VEDLDQLTHERGRISTASLVPGKHYVAHVELKDGRVLKAPVTVDPPRPQITLLSKGVQRRRIGSAAAAGTTGQPGRHCPLTGSARVLSSSP